MLPVVNLEGTAAQMQTQLPPLFTREHTCTHRHTNPHTHTHTHLNTHTHTHSLTHIHTHNHIHTHLQTALFYMHTRKQTHNRTAFVVCTQTEDIISLGFYTGKIFHENIF